MENKCIILVLREILKGGYSMVDIHSHILYGVDDGSKSEEMSLNMLALAVKSGVKEIVATPHYMRGRFDLQYCEVIKAVDKLQSLADDNEINIKVYVGQEIYYSNNLLQYYNDKEIGTINNSRYMLIELPIHSFNIDEVIDSIYELKIKGIVPIIAHPERYKLFIKKPEKINKLIDEGYLFQLNTGSLTGDFGEKVKKTAKLFLKHNIYSVVGSDGHRDNWRTTNMTPFLDIIKENQIANFKDNSVNIIQNNNINFNGKRVKKRRLFNFKCVIRKKRSLYFDKKY